MVRSIVGNIAIAAFFLFFVYANVKGFNLTGDFLYILTSINQGVYVGLYLIRKRPVATSTSMFDWGVAFSATFLGILLRPAFPLNSAVGGLLICIGFTINTISVVYLNRSLGLVPAERSIKTDGPYRFIRHPLYSSDIISFLGYVLANFSFLNLAIVISNTVLMLIRINREEAFLARNERYHTYIERTPWKLVPFVY